MAEQPEDAWERLAAVCEAANIPLTVVDRTPRFERWWQGYTERTLAEATMPDHLPSDPES